jgi:hypothetical protein
MLPRFESLLMALMIALLLVAGTLGVYTAEASSYRSATGEARAYDQFTPVTAYNSVPEGSEIVAFPGLPY